MDDAPPANVAIGSTPGATAGAPAIAGDSHSGSSNLNAAPSQPSVQPQAQSGSAAQPQQQQHENQGIQASQQQDQQSQSPPPPQHLPLDMPRDEPSIQLLALQTQSELKQLLHHIGVFISTLAAFTSTDAEYVENPALASTSSSSAALASSVSSSQASMPAYIENPYVLQDPHQSSGSTVSHMGTGTESLPSSPPPSTTMIAKRKRLAELLMQDLSRCQENYLSTIQTISHHLELLDKVVTIHRDANGGIIWQFSMDGNQSDLSTQSGDIVGADAYPSSLIQPSAVQPPSLASFTLESINQYPQDVIRTQLTTLGVATESTFPSEQAYINYLRNLRSKLRDRIITQNQRIRTILDTCRSTQQALALYRL